MQDEPVLTERQRLILKAIIDAHVRSGEPVGSKLLAQDERLSLSSASIRNVMSDLERLGYLEQPHTSAGRIPSGKGYRYYVSSLMNTYSLSGDEKNQLDSAPTVQLLGLDTMLRGVAETASRFTDYTALAVKPRMRRTLVLSYKLLPMNDYGILMVMQTSVGIVKTRFIEMGFKVSEDMAFKLQSALNDHLTGVSVEDVTPALIKEMENELSVLTPLLIPIMRAFMEEIGTLNGGELRIEGMNRMLRYPEYSNLENVKGLLGALEQKDYILSVVSSSQNDGVNVFVSPEDEDSALKGTSLVFKTVTENERPVAAIGVIGPCRMDYPKVISTVEYLTDKLKDAIKTDNGNNYRKD